MVCSATRQKTSTRQSLNHNQPSCHENKGNWRRFGLRIIPEYRVLFKTLFTLLVKMSLQSWYLSVCRALTLRGRVYTHTHLVQRHTQIQRITKQIRSYPRTHKQSREHAPHGIAMANDKFRPRSLYRIIRLRESNNRNILPTEPYRLQAISEYTVERDQHPSECNQLTTAATRPKLAREPSVTV